MSVQEHALLNLICKVSELVLSRKIYSDKVADFGIAQSTPILEARHLVCPTTRTLKLFFNF